MFRNVGLLSLVLLIVGARSVKAEEQQPRPLEVYGFAQGDLIEDFRRVNPAWAATLRPSRIPTESGLFGQNGEAVVSVRQSRLGVRAATETGWGKLKAQIEFDFFGVGPDEGQTTIRLRHAWGELGMFAAGQTNSLFMDGDVFPDVIDYWGPCGMVFLRTPQLRFTPLKGNLELAFAFEKASNDIDAGVLRDLDPSLSANQHTYLPDLTAHVKYSGERGHIQLATIFRQLGYEVLGTPNNEPHGSSLGWGVDLSGTVKFLEKDRLVLSVVYGHGIASFMNDGGVDMAAHAKLNGTGNEGFAIPLLGMEAYIEHAWTKQLSSAIGYSLTQVENTNLQEGGAFHRGQYASVNLLGKPIDDVLAGIEALWGMREDKDGSNGTDVRLQVSLKYSFSKP